MIVSCIFVDVVNDFALFEIAANVLLNYQAMLKNVALVIPMWVAWVVNVNIPICTDISSTSPLAIEFSGSSLASTTHMKASAAIVFPEFCSWSVDWLMADATYDSFATAWIGCKLSSLPCLDLAFCMEEKSRLASGNLACNTKQHLSAYGTRNIHESLTFKSKGNGPRLWFDYAKAQAQREEELAI